jgi:Zn-dependent protease
VSKNGRERKQEQTGANRSKQVRTIFPPGGRGAFPQGTNETQELFKAWAATSLAYAIALVHGRIQWSLFTFLLIAALTCGIGFVVHELAHRLLARHYDAEAHFAAHNEWLLISILVAFTGFFIAAPGAVWHRGNVTRQQSGLIALVGPVSNLVLALVFLGLFPLVQGVPFLALTCRIGYAINAWLGLFNMIPFGPLDGAKVLAWEQRVVLGDRTYSVPLVFGLTLVVALVMVFLVPF